MAADKCRECGAPLENVDDLFPGTGYNYPLCADRDGCTDRIADRLRAEREAPESGQQNAGKGGTEEEGFTE